MHMHDGGDHDRPADQRRRGSCSRSHGIDGVSLREINRAAGAKNASALQYHFRDRDGLLRALMAKHRRDVEARRHAMLDAYEADGRDDLRALAGALVRPMAAKLADADGGPEYLQILADLMNRPRADRRPGRPRRPGVEHLPLAPARRRTCSTRTSPACTAASWPSASPPSSSAAAPGPGPTPTTGCSPATWSTSSPACSSAPLSDETRRLDAERRPARRPAAGGGAHGVSRAAAGSDTGTDLVDVDALAAWMDDQGLPGGADHRGPGAGRRHPEPAHALPPGRPRLRAAPRPPPPAPGQQRGHAPRGPGAAGAGRAATCPTRPSSPARASPTPAWPATPSST